MLLGVQQFMNAGKRLPYDAEVEYLESTHPSTWAGLTQWIDTGVYPDYGLTISLAYQRLSKTNTDSWGCVFGILLSGSLSGFGPSIRDALSATQGANNNGWRNSSSYENYTRRDVTLSGSHITVNGSSWSLTKSSTPSVPGNKTLLLFQCALENSSSPDGLRSFHGRIWYCRIEKDGVLVRDFIPVRFTNENGVSEGVMFDRVSGELFRNSGTGAFVIGPDKAASNGGGYKCKCVRRSYRRSARPSRRFWQPRLWKEVA